MLAIDFTETTRTEHRKRVKTANWKAKNNWNWNGCCYIDKKKSCRKQIENCHTMLLKLKHSWG